MFAAAGLAALLSGDLCHDGRRRAPCANRARLASSRTRPTLCDSQKCGDSDMRTLALNHILLCIGAMIVIAGCTVDDISPVTPESTLPDYWTGDENFICGRWHDRRPDSTYVLTDIAVHSSVSISENLDLLKAHGADIRYIFNVPLIRVIISVDELESLYYQGEYLHALGVPDHDSYVVEHLIVSYDHTITEADSAALLELGVDIVRESYSRTFLLVTAEDEVIPLILQLTGVLHVSLDHFACLHREYK